MVVVLAVGVVKRAACRRRSRSAIQISTARKRNRHVETAAITGLTCSVTSSQNCFGSVA